MRVSALASGSSGNAFLVEAGDVRLLFDAGLNAARIEQFMRLRGVKASSLSAIFLSHEHIDHIRGVGMLARRYRLPVIANDDTFEAGAKLLGVLPEKLVQPTGRMVRVGDITVRTFAVSHDAAATVGFFIRAYGQSACICTDLGVATDAIREPLGAADLLVLESNHDIKRLWSGPYPINLKKRVASHFGHLGNADAAELVQEIAQDGRPRTVWLAHLSAVNNTPELALNTVTAPLERAGCTHIKLEVLARDLPSGIWDGATASEAVAI